MNFKNLNSLATPRVKALFGLLPTHLADLLFVVLPELECRRTARLESRADRKRKLVANDGRPRTVTPLHKVLMTLIYLRHNVQHEVVGALFGLSADTAENACHEVVPVLRDCFPAEKWDAEKQWRRSAPPWTPEAVDKVIIDSFESPVRRPSLPERQKRVYSGKKKRHTLKSQVVTDAKGEILDLDSGHRGPTADKRLYEQSTVEEHYPRAQKQGDLAYQGIAGVSVPHKKPKG